MWWLVVGKGALNSLLRMARLLCNIQLHPLTSKRKEGLEIQCIINGQWLNQLFLFLKQNINSLEEHSRPFSTSLPMLLSNLHSWNFLSSAIMTTNLDILPFSWFYLLFSFIPSILPISNVLLISTISLIQSDLFDLNSNDTSQMRFKNIFCLE